MMLEPLQIFCIDDDPHILHIVDLSLGLDASISVRTALTGDEALRVLLGPDYTPDCILLDRVMPHVDGTMLFGEIRAMPHHRDTPVIFLTTSVLAESQTDYLRLGARGMIAKPFDPLLLASQVRNLL